MHQLEILKKAARSYAWLLAEKIVKMILGLFVSTWVARHLGPADFGRITYATTYALLFYTLAGLGLDAITLREMSRKPTAATEILNATRTIRLISGVLLYVAATALNYWITMDIQSTMLVALLGFMIFAQALESTEHLYQALSASRRAAIVRICVYLAGALAKLCAIKADLKIMAFAAIAGAEYIFVGLGLHMFLKKSVRAPVAKNDWAATTSYIKEGFPYLLTAVSILIYMRIDQYFINHFLGPRDLGIYGAAFVITSITQFVPTTLATALIPHITKAKESRVGYEVMLTASLQLYIVVGISISSLTYLGAQFAVDTLYGQGFSEAAPILRILAINNLLICLGLWHSIKLSQENKGRIGLYKTIMGATVAFIGNALFTEDHGLQAVALTAVAAQLSSTVIASALWDWQGFRMQLRGIAFIEVFRFLRNRK